MKKLLAIVDDWERLERIEDRFRTRFEVLCAPFGAMGVQMAIEQDPDLILVDLEFEDMDEIEALALIRDEESLIKTPVVVISNPTGPNPTSQSALDEKVRILTRPVSVEDLFAFMESEFWSKIPRREESRK